MSLAREVQALKFQLGYAEQLLADVPAERFTEQPTPGMNHAAWVLGHLAFSMDAHSRSLGGEPELGAWNKRFGFGSEVLPELEAYPGKDELLNAFRGASARLMAAAESCSPAMLAKASKGPGPELMPTVGDAMTFMMVGHVALHLGQLSAWRRALGLPRLF